MYSIGVISGFALVGEAVSRLCGGSFVVGGQLIAAPAKRERLPKTQQTRDAPTSNNLIIAYLRRRW